MVMSSSHVEDVTIIATVVVMITFKNYITTNRIGDEITSHIKKKVRLVLLVSVPLKP